MDSKNDFEETEYSKISEYRLDGPSRSVSGVPTEFDKESEFYNIAMIPVNWLLDGLSWIVIILLMFFGLGPIGILLAVKGLVSYAVSKQFRTKVKRFGGFINWFGNALLTSGEIVWQLLFNIPRVGDNFNILMTTLILQRYVNMMGNMPKYDMEHDYVCQAVYDNRGKVYARQLPKCNDEYSNRLPSVDKVAKNLFLRDLNVASGYNGHVIKDGYKIETNRNASLLLSHYAQWLTHEFFNTKAYSRDDPKGCWYTNQPVGFNLSQLYGSTKETRDRLRLFKGGLMKSQWVHGKEWLPIKNVDPKSEYTTFIHNAKYRFDTPIELANFTPGFMAIQTLWFRHHQYVARTLAKQYPEWDDERLFEISKLIVHLCVFQVTVNDYVRCISNKYGISWFRPQLATDLFTSKTFKIFGPSKCHTTVYSIVAEFNILYRWHQMFPETVKVMKSLDYDKTEFSEGSKGKDFDRMEYIDESVRLMVGSANNRKYENNLERILLSAHLQHSGKICLKNHAAMLVDAVVKRGMYETRIWKLQSFNDYRAGLGFERLEFDEFTEDATVTEALKNTYESADDIELYPGYFAGDKDDGALHAPFLSDVGAAWTFPGLFAMEILKEGKDILNVIKPIGVKIISETPTLDSLAHLHTNLEKGSLSFFCKSKP